MQTVTIHLGVLIALIISIVLLIIILIVLIRSHHIKPPERESDELPLRRINSVSDEVLSRGPLHRCNAPPQAPSKAWDVPVIALSADDITIARKWMARRGIGEGVNYDTWAGKYELTLDKQPKDGVDGGILLPGLGEEDQKKWEESGKPVMVEGQDPVVETKGWAPSLTYPFKTLLARVIDEIKVHKTEVV